MTPGQIKKTWLESAQTWWKWAKRTTRRADRIKAETLSWHAIFKAVTRL